MSRVWPLLLALAIVAGAWLNFTGLGARQLSLDEGASWSAASAPTAATVAREQAARDPGKLAVYDLVLHWWMRWFGEGLAALRAPGALSGVAAIALVFMLTRELFGAPDAATDTNSIAALSALIFATSLIMIKYARDARPFAMGLAVLLAQMTLFLRMGRRGSLIAAAALALTTALAAAISFTAAAVFAVEGIWVLGTGATRLARRQSVRAPATQAAAVALGGVLLLPFAIEAMHSSASAISRGVYGWIQPPLLWAPFSLFSKGTGTFAFPALAILAAWGALIGWRRRREAIGFALLWMWLPPLAVLAASYALRPMFVERYLLACFVPFFVLAAAGIAELPAAAARSIALALVLALSIGHVHSWNRKPHDDDWRGATRIAAQRLAPSQTMTALPAYAIDVVRYYLPAPARARAVRVEQANDDCAVLLAPANLHAHPRAKAILKRYPRVVARARGVVVRGR
jgi:mannosyltransferase